MNMSESINIENEFDFESEEAEAEEIASILMGGTIFISKEQERKKKNRARYKLKKNPKLKELVMNILAEWKSAREEELGGIEVMQIMARSFRQYNEYYRDTDA